MKTDKRNKPGRKKKAKKTDSFGDVLKKDVEILENWNWGRIPNTRFYGRI